MKASTFLPFLIIFFIGFFNSVDVKTQWIGQKLDINKVCMLDTSAGWAVGNNGNIYKIKDFEWEKVELPFFTESDFQSVHFTDINHGWVGGDNGLLLQYENNEWYIHNLNDMGLYSVRSIFFADSSMGWIAGGGNGIIKYENQQFKKYELPNWYYLNDMFFTDTSQGWAVGDEGKIFKYENGNWTQESSNTNNSLFSVYFSDENNGRAVGYNVILKFEGLQWTEEQYPEEIDYIELKSVSFTSLLNGYATGNNSRILKFNGINWLVDSTYVNYEWPNLMYVNYISSSEIWLIDSHGKIYKSDGSEWSILNEKIELSNPNDIFFTDSVNGWAIDNNYIMWQHTESGWQIFDTITDTYPYELFFTDANNGFALGGGNQYLKFDGTEWTRIPFENWNWYNINSIYFTDSIHGWAAGYNGIILKYNDSVWIEENSGTYQTLRSVFFTDTLNGWAVGDSGIILKYNGTSWERQNSPTDMDLYSIWITGQNKGWAVGESSIIIEYDGTDWTIQQIGQYEWYYLYSVFFTDSSHGWAAGYSGTLLRYDGNEWKTQNLGYHYYFQDMFFTDSLNGWLIGYNTLLHTINAGGIYLPKQESIKFVGSIKSIFDWNYDTIHVLSDIRYNGDEILTINQGSHINFHGPFSIETYNPVEFIGEESDSIYFTNCDTCTRKWESIYIYNYSSKDSSIFKYCSFKGSKDQTLYLYGSGPSSISHCLFDSLYNGLYLSNSSGGIITNSTFTNINNTGINLNNSNNFNLYNIQIKKCNTGLYFSNSSAILNNITISECLYYSANFDNSNASLINSKICNNDLYVPLYVYNSKVDVINCLIGNNRSYSNNANSIYISYSKINILNSTIVNNETTYFTGSALYFRFSNGNIVNSILWGNINNSDTSQIYIYNNNSKPNFYNCNIQGGINEIETESLEVTYNGNYIQNIDTLPLFENPTDSAGSDFNAFEANWQLQPNSPLINLGRNNFENITYPETDLNGQKRILNGIIDIGAYETHILSYEYTCDTIKGNVYWTADTIRIKNCDVLIDYNSTLHIPPGVRIEFYSQNKIIVHGSIKASGNRYNPIVFTVDDTLGFWSSDTVGWIGIEYNNNDGKMDNSDSSIFNYCRFEYVVGIDEWQQGVFKVLDFPKLVIKNSVFINNRDFRDALINLMRADVIIQGNEFYQNRSSVIYMYMSDAVISSNQFINNFLKYSENDKYKNIINISGSDAYINNNKFFNNITFFSPIINSYSSNIKYFNNLICNNSIDSSEWNGIIYGYGGNYTIGNNTLINNSSTGIYFGGATLKLFNNILWNNTEYNISYWSLTLDSYVKNNLIGGYWWPDDVMNENNISDTPRVVNPTIEKGKLYNASIADWRLSQFSPCINSGIDDTTGLNIPKYDIIGNERISGNQIDIGAYEQQGTKPEIIEQPANIIACEGDTAIFTILTSDTAFYQWQKDGINIQGANKKNLTIYGIKTSDEGSYGCIVSNAYGTVPSSQVYLLTKTQPFISSQPEDIWVNKSRKATLSVQATGTEPLLYQWYKDTSEFIGKTLPILKLTNVDQNDEGKYFCQIGNSCGMISTDTVNMAIVPQLCMVTVDSITNNNLVVWDINSIYPYEYYNIYREGTVSGYYQKIGTVHYNDTTVFEDTTVNAKSQAYMYKITATDSLGFETDLDYCSPHKTIHLLVTEGVPTGFQLDWDEYIGFDYGQYKIYRSINDSPFELVHEQAATTRTWTDFEAPEGFLQYYVAVEKAGGCYPSLGWEKASAGPFDRSSSNLEDNRLRAENEAPTNLFLSGYMIPENQDIGTFIGKLSVVDPDENDTITYTIGPENSGNTYFSIIGDRLYSNYVYDYETQNLYEISITAVDLGSNEITEEFTIHIINVDPEGADTNAAPINIYLMGNSIYENADANTFIGEFSTIDPNTEDTHIYTLNSGNSHFYLDDDQLYSNEVFDFETKYIYSISVTSEDNEGLQISKDFNILVLDVYEPLPTEISEDELNNEFIIYPNPGNGWITIGYNVNINSVCTIEVLNSVGKVVYFENNINLKHQNTYEVDLSNQMKGFYIFRLISDEYISIKLIIIQ